jgi:hypothetical protein
VSETTEVVKPALAMLAAMGFVVVTGPGKNTICWGKALSILRGSNAPGVVWRSNTGKMGYIQFGIIGTADICGFRRDGMPIAIECKLPNRRTDPKRAEQQRAYADLISELGGVSFTITDPVQVQDWQSELLRRHT